MRKLYSLLHADYSSLQAFPRAMVVAIVAILSCLGSNSSFAQASSANYAFSSSSSGSMVDMSSGTTQLIGSGADIATSAITPIPFTFVFMGVPYNYFMASSDGAMKLGDASMNTSGIGTTNDLTPTTVYPVIAPFWDDLATSTPGKVHYKIIGSAPNRTLVVEWMNMRIRYSSSSADGTYQAVLHEGTGVIDFIYGAMNIGAGQTTAITASIGFSNGNTANTFASVTSLSPVTVSTTTDENNLVNIATAGPITGLNSASDGSRVVFTWTPPVPDAPSNVSFTGVTASAMTVNWVDNSSNELGYVIYRSTDNVNFTQVGTVAANSTTFNATSLAPATLYYWKVQAVSEGALSTAATGSQATNAGTLNGVKTVGAGGDYNNLTTAFADINSNGLSGNIVLQLITGYPASPETYPILSSNSVVGSYSVTIYPTVSGLSITSSNTTGTLNLNAANNILIDGRVNATGTTKDLVIENTTTAGYAVQFINDAVNNSINYCVVRGANTSATNGVVSFSTTTGTLGNSNNTISNSDLRDATGTPANLIYSAGTAASPNSNNTVNANNIYNFFIPGATDAAGVHLEAGNTGWTITNNSFYQTGTRTSTGSATNRPIYVNSAAGNGFTISGNFIGGNATGATGTWTNGGAFANRFIGIHLVVGTTTSSTVQNNTVRNITFTSTSGATTEPGVWAAMSLTGSMNATGNTIGDVTGSGSISVTSTTTGAITYGAVISGGTGSTINFNNNTIGSITLLGSTTSIGHSFRAISNTTSGTISISNNTIGSATTANSINLSTATGGTIVQEFTAIRNTSSLPILTINNNVIANINNATTSTSASSLTRGIVSSAGVATIKANTIRNITSSSAGTSTGASASVSGISYTATTTGNHVIAENVIYSLANTAPASASYVIGIHYAGPTTGDNIVGRNFVHSLSLASTSATATLIGINASSGFAKYQNNMVRLGINAAGGSLTNGNIVVGIDKASTTGNNFYHNTVYIDGQGVTTNAANSFAFRRTATPTTSDSIYNNIFVNNRSNAGSTGKHYAIGLNNNTFALINYNLYYGTGAGFIFGYIGTPGTTDYTSFASWKAANPAFDANSQFANPLFVNPTGDAATVDLHITAGSPAEGSGLSTASAFDDFDGETRSTLTPTDIGADAGNYGFAGTDVGITALVSPASSGCYSNAEQVSVTLKNFSSNPINFATNNVTVTVTASGAGTYSSNIVINSGTLAAGGTLNVVLPATFNMTAQGTYNFDATAAVTSGSADVNPSNNNLPTTTRTNNVFGGSYLVGVGETYTTLTSAVAAYNAATCLSGPVTFTLKDPTYPSETFPIAIKGSASASATNTLTIKPAAGVATTISGTSATSMIELRGADYVIIDGLNAGASSLTVQNTNTGTSSSVFYLNSPNSTDGATHNTIRNVTITGNAPTTTFAGIVSSASGTLGGVAESANTNNSFENNQITSVYYGIVLVGSSANDAGNVINGNTIGSATAASKIGSNGIALFQQQGVTVSNNTILGVVTSSSSTTSGIRVSGTISGGNIFNNKISDVKNTNTTGFGANGIQLNSSSTAANLSIYNNMISDVAGYGYAALVGVGDNGYGIIAVSGGGYNIYFNSINLNTNQTTGVSAAINITSGITTAGSIDLRDNIFANTQTANTRYSIYNAAATTVFADINNNDYYTTGANLGYSGGAAVANLAAWQTATGKDAASLSVDPLFVSATDLHLQTASPVKDAGVTIAGITKDIDFENRDASPDMGADELMGVVPVSFTNIKAYQQNAGVQVDWNIVTELNVASYEVEKSTDGRDFKKAGAVAARNAGNYNWFDASPVAGNNYYRIKAVSVNGAAQYTSVAKVFVGKAGSAISVYPNPVKGDLLNLQLINLPKGSYTVSVSNQAGQKVFSQVISHNGGSANQALNFNNKLAAGIYQLQLVGHDVQFAQTIMKQ